MQNIPIFTFDGPSASGKGTISKLLAKNLKYNFLDSGAIYRVLGLAALKKDTDLQNEKALAKLAVGLDLVFSFTTDLETKISLDGKDVSYEVRTPECGNIASKISVFTEVRKALLERQRAFLKSPGLIADGRDMGTVVFPEAGLKFFLDAKPEIRAKRRLSQLKKMGIDVSMERILLETLERDKRDSSRSFSPLEPAKDAILLDTGEMSIEQVIKEVTLRVETYLLKSIAK